MFTKAKAQKAETEQKIDDQICFSPKSSQKARTRNKALTQLTAEKAEIFSTKTSGWLQTTEKSFLLALI